ncbi:hypothetical protein ALO94_200834 [Pseudomonas syringae pv. spinaceae]|uniref:Copper resistance protein B n=1 Tax=Pseudomonas syringae pv. spinaceae TaxID=264459 RepID=A0A0N8T6X9_PSESX|nr:hypothetical protein ALO94_200834 [Pseudomonas syringae pv. spinaceae]
MHIGQVRQACRVNLHHWADQHDLPVGLRLSQLPDQVDIKTLVNDAKKAEPRIRNVLLISRIRLHAASGGKMPDIDTAGHGVRVGMLQSLGLPKAETTGEDNICTFHQRAFLLDKLWRRTFERRQFVHAIKDRHLRIEVVGERQAHRGEIPQQQLTELLRLNETIQ